MGRTASACVLAAAACAIATSAVAESGARVGPSFACAPGQDPLAQLICREDALALADLLFVQAFEALWWQSDAGGRAALRTEEDAFRTRVLTECGIPGSGSIGGPAENTTQCSAGAYDGRREIWRKRLSGAAGEEASRPRQILMERGHNASDLVQI